MTLKALDLKELGSAIATTLESIRATGTASALVVSEVGVVLDVRLDSLVEGDEDFDIFDTVLLHPFTSLDVAFENRPPETEALVFHLATDTQQGADVRQTVHDKAKLFDCLD